MIYMKEPTTQMVGCDLIIISLSCFFNNIYKSRDFLVFSSVFKSPFENWTFILSIFEKAKDFPTFRFLKSRFRP